VLEAAFVLLECSSPSRRIFIGSHSLPPSLVRRIGPSPWARTPRQPTTRRSVRSGTARVEPPSRPLPLRHVLMPAAPANQRRRRGTRAAPPPAGYWPSPLAPPIVPCCNPLGDDFRDPLHKARAPIKAISHRRAPCPHTEPPLQPPEVLPVNSTSDCLSSQTRAAPHSTRTPCSSCTRLLACPSRRLTRASVPVAAAGQPSASSTLRATPEPTNPSSTFPRAPRSPACSTLLSPTCSLTGLRAATALLLRCRRRRSPVTPRPSYHRQPPRGEPNRLPRRLFATPCSTSPPASSPLPPGARERNQGYGCEDSKTSRDPSAKRFLSLGVLQLKLVTFI
jgi:hypothetical protein